MGRRGLRRAGLVLAGALMGLFGFLIALWFYMQAAQVAEVRTAVGERLRLAREAIERVEVLEQGALRISLRDVALLGEQGDTILAAPRLRLTLAAATLEGDGAIEFYDVEVMQPFARLVVMPDGEWNYLRALQLTAAGQPVETEAGRPVLLRDVRLVDGRLIVAIPSDPPPPADARFAANLPITQLFGEWYQVYNVSDVQALLPGVRIGGPQGWRAEIASATARIEEPDIRITQMAGWAEQIRPDGVRFDLATLRFGESIFAGSGLIRFPDEGPLYDVEIQADSLLLADLRPLFPTMPPEGVARFDVAVRSLTAERVALDFRGLDLEALDSRLLGRIGFVVGGGLPLALTAADLEIAPLQLLALEQLGLTDELPVVGQVTGRVTTTDAPAGMASVDLLATLLPRGQPAAPVSTLFAAGNVTVGDSGEPLRFEGLTVGFQPLHLAMLAALAPEQAELLRGELRGSVTLAGTTGEIQLTGGDMTYLVGDAPPTHLAGMEGSLTLRPQLAYDLRAIAQPIALATLTELFPALPFRTATLSGPIQLSGNAERAEVSADLTSIAGGLRFAGEVEFSDPLRFDVEGSLSAFSAGMLLRPDVPVEGPLTGTFAVRGTTEEFAFDVDLTQIEGRFALRGTIAPRFDPPRFRVTGDLFSFRLGALLGQPMLFPDPLTGPITVAGGGGDPYRFDVDLRGEIGQLTLAGFYDPTPVATYEVAGEIAGLDVSRLPLAVALPSTALTGTLSLRGRGTDLETLEGFFALDGGRSSVAGLQFDAALARLEVGGGVLRVDTLHFELADTRLAAGGEWGLTRPATAPLRYTFESPDLSALRRIAAVGGLIPPQLTGSILATGEIAGSFDHPVFTTTLEGRNLRFDDWRASSLSLNLRAFRDPLRGVGGEMTLAGDNVVLPLESFQAIRIEASGTDGVFSLGLFARRDARSDIAASGVLELDGLVPLGIDLQTLALRVDGIAWELLAPSRIRWAEQEGLMVENLMLTRNGTGEGLIAIHGNLPPTGMANLTVRAEGIDLADIRRILRTGPALEGLLTLDVVLEGPVTDPELSIRISADQFGYEGVLTDRVVFDGRYRGGRLVGYADATMAGQRLFHAELSVPMLLSLEQLVPTFELLQTDPISITASADSLPLDLVAAVVPGLSNGTGVVRAEILVGGTLDVPALDGWARLEDGAITIDPLRVRYNAIQSDLTLVQNRVVINSLSARSGGTLSVSGSIDFPAGVPARFAITSGFEGFRFMDDPAVGRLTASGQLALTGAGTTPVLTGTIEVRESTIRVPDFAQEQPGLELGYADIGAFGQFPDDEIFVTAPLLGNVEVDGVQLSIAESVWLESNEMRVQITGDLVIYRVGEDLRIFGALQAVRGTYALEISAITREFDVIRGRVQFFGTGDLNPSLDILAGYRVRGTTVGRGGDLTVLVNVGGTLLTPRVQLTSDTPVPLSEADLISYLLFGQPSFELGGVTRTFAEQILVQEVVGGILAAELERPILRAGLCDWVRVRPGITTTFRGLFGAGPLAGAAIECGWELAPDFFLTGQTGIGGLFGGEFTDWRLGLEWQIDDQWLWEASYGAVQRDRLFRVFDPVQRYQISTDLRRRWEYGLPTRQPLLDLLPPEEQEEPTPVLPGALPLE